MEGGHTHLSAGSSFSCSLLIPRLWDGAGFFLTPLVTFSHDQFLLEKNQ